MRRTPVRQHTIPRTERAASSEVSELPPHIPEDRPEQLPIVDIRAYLRIALNSAVTAVFGNDVASSCDYVVAQPRRRVRGHLYSPLALGLAPQLKLEPEAIARAIVEASVWDSAVVDDPRQNVVGGFINFRMSRAYLHRVLLAAVTAPGIPERDLATAPPRTTLFEVADARFAERMAIFHARQCSLLRHVAVQGFSESDVQGANAALLVAPEEVEVLVQLAEFPHVLAQAAAAAGPLRITTYVEGLAAAFHAFYQKHRVVSGDRALSAGRLQLTCGVRNVVRVALRLLGVSSPESM